MLHHLLYMEFALHNGPVHFQLHSDADHQAVCLLSGRLDVLIIRQKDANHFRMVEKVLMDFASFAHNNEQHCLLLVKLPNQSSIICTTPNW